MGKHFGALLVRLWSPRWWGWRNHIKQGGGLRAWFKPLFLGAVALAFWLGILALMLKVLHYFKSIEDIGNVLSLKLLSMTMMTAFALLIFSAVLTCLSKLYLSKDLLMVHSLPVPAHTIFLGRWVESMIDSAWMVMLYILPILIGYGVVFESGILFYIYMILVMVLIASAAAALAGMLTAVLVMIVPANRMRSIFVLLGLLVFSVLYIAFRMLRPEQLVDPEVFDSVLSFVAAMETTTSAWLPSTWAYDALGAALTGAYQKAFFHLMLLFLGTGSLICLLLLLADAYYYKGFSKTQTAPSRFFKKQYPDTTRQSPTSSVVGALFRKELTTFLRDQSQWTQLFLIGALVLIYVYNFKVLPLDKAPLPTFYLQNLMAFLNMALALFVLTAVSARFAYPAVSTEKEAFWIVRAAPISISQFVWIKYVFYMPPLLVLTLALILITNVLLQVTLFMMVLSIATVLLLVPGIVAMGLGLGAAFPDFKAENPTQTVTGFGGILFMILCAMYIAVVLMLEAGPVYHVFMAGIKGRAVSHWEWAWLGISATIILVMSGLAVWLPMRMGIKRLSKFRI